MCGTSYQNEMLISCNMIAISHDDLWFVFKQAECSDVERL